MAVVFRNTSDLLYLPDHGYVAEDGAIKILLQVTRQIRRIDVSHNLLGIDGTNVLIQGLNSSRFRYSSADYGIWGLRDINLGSNGLNDDNLANILGYAKKDVCMRRIWLQGNNIELANHFDSFMNSLNSSRVEVLSLTNNASLSSSSLRKLFDTLITSHLSELYLSTCNIGPELAQPIIRYLSSERSRNLELLELNGNHIGVEGVKGIVDTVEKYNFTIKQIGLLANDEVGPSSSRSNGHSNGEASNDVEEVGSSKTPEQRQQEARELHYQVHTRLHGLLERNRILTKRARRAAIRVIAPARILLNARKLNDQEIARQVIDTVGTDNGRPFPLLDLPREILYHIVRHCSRDPIALSEAQFTRIRAEAEDRGSMMKTRRIMHERLMKSDVDQMGRVIWEVREEWLRRGKWDKWELDRPLQPPEFDEKSEENETAQQNGDLSRRDLGASGKDD